MPSSADKPLYAFTLDNTLDPPACFPAWLDRSGLIDVTQRYHQFRVYFDPKTGHTHDGAAYYEEAKQYGQAS